MTGSSPSQQTGRNVTVMLTGGLPPPASIEFRDEAGRIVQRYTPTGLDETERAMNVDLIKAVKLSLLCFNAHWPPSPPLRHAKADVVERLNGVVARAEALIGEKVDDPPLPGIVLPGKQQ